jgi:glycerol-3-phosphate acyltransferase PlsY
MLFPILIAVVVGYFLGAIPFGYLVARAYGVDIFTAGSGNPGATNVKRVLGARAGNLVFALDAVKGAVAAAWPALLWVSLGDPYTDSFWSRLAETSAGHFRGMCAAGLFAAVIGHSFSVFTRFKGGKGVATASGGLLVLMPVPILIGAATWLITFFASGYVSLGSIFGALAVPAAAWAIGLPVVLKIVATILGVLIIVRHRSNIRRLLSGTEHRWGRKPREGGDGEPLP